MSLVDRYGASVVDLSKAFALCAPADKNGEDPEAPTRPDHLTLYGIVRGAPFAKVSGQIVTNQFGSLTLDVIKPARLAVPTTKALSGEPPPPPAPVADHYQCYKARHTRGTTRFARRVVTISTQLEQDVAITLVKPIRLCVPVDKNGEGIAHPDLRFVCYRARGATGLTVAVNLNNQFGIQDYLITQRREFCVGSSPGPYGSPSAAFLVRGDLLD